MGEGTPPLREPNFNFVRKVRKERKMCLRVRGVSLSLLLVCVCVCVCVCV